MPPPLWNPSSNPRTPPPTAVAARGSLAPSLAYRHRARSEVAFHEHNELDLDDGSKSDLDTAAHGGGFGSETSASPSVPGMPTAMGVGGGATPIASVGCSLWGRYCSTKFLTATHKAGDYLQRRYRIILRSTMGPIDVYLVSQFEKKFEGIDASIIDMWKTTSDV
ncbi:hypothetical protein GUJ93_ZPchr0011g28519 [Zizania palustris]|uniref:Uncharacterized protein n=1 Tax=Zizania palustris TaxID=103762 RepID=A0A8J5WH00_ZIZPA|nr:hypothetical protein GUJ93_ZPchr0011g28519 [Zizania palustris]